MEYRKSSHAVYGLQYHIVLVTKYRRKCINEEIGDRLKKEIIRLIEGHEGHVVSIETVCDHVHILAELSPKICSRERNRYVKNSYCKDSEKRLWRLSETIPMGR